MVAHTAEGANQVPAGAGTPGYYVINPMYANDLTTDQLAVLVRSSKQCWQWLSMECRSVRIFDGNNAVSWWVANDGSRQLNWAAPEGVEGCGCSQEFSKYMAKLFLVFALNHPQFDF